MQAGVSRLTRQQVSWELFDRALKIPGFEFIDAAGRKWSNKSYFDMLARTELMNAGRASCDDKCAQEGFDLMILTTSGDSCDKCARFEGKLFSLSGEIEGVPSKQDLIDAGVFHPNCTHSYSFVPDYVAETKYGIKVNRKGEKQQPEPKPETKPETKAEPKPKAKPKQETKPKAEPKSKESRGQAKRAEAPFGFGGRKRAAEAKFDGTFTEAGKTLDRRMRRKGINAEARDEINWNYTPRIQELCKNPPNVSSGTSWPGVKPGTLDMEISPDPDAWEGCRPTVTHEFGHYVANSVFDLLAVRSAKKFAEVAIADYKALLESGTIERFKGLTGDKEKIKAMQDVLAKEMFDGRSFSELSLEEKWKIAADMDILGSVSGGLYGFGHLKVVYLEDDFREAFANMYLAKKYGWTEFKRRWPKLWKYMEELLK